MEEAKKTVIFFDSGDTIIDESTQVFDSNGTIIGAKLLHGAEHTLRSLKESGHEMVMVADGNMKDFENVYRKNGLWGLFTARIYSEAIGICKPDKRMFLAALGAVGLHPNDVSRVIMVGNNLSRDIKGANALGIKSVFMKWSPRYPENPSDVDEEPDYTIGKLEELLPIVDYLDNQLKA